MTSASAPAGRAAPGFVARAVLRLSFIEAWERYSFFTLFALLPLFVAAPVTTGGMGWSDGEALRFFGVYLLAVQLSPLAGGYLADRWLGARRALTLGAVLLLLGHLLMAAVTLIPHLPGAGTEMARSAAAGGFALGSWTAPAALPLGSAAPYTALSLAFYASVAFVAAGNGLFKPVLTAVVGRLPHRDDAERNAAFTTFFLYLNIGGLVSLLLGGWLVQALGWTWAFAVSASGMVVAIAAMRWLGPVYLLPFAGGPISSQATGAAGGESVPASWLAGVAVLLVAFVVACTFSYQSYGFVNLFTARLVDRSVFGFEIPPPWFTALNPITIMAVSPVLVWLWQRRRLGHDWSPTGRVAASLVVMSVAFGCLVGAALEARQGLAHPGWVVSGIMLIAVGELLFTPAINSAVTRLLPGHRQGVGLGALTAATGIGAWLSGRIGAVAAEGDTARVLAAVASAAMLIALVTIAARKRLRRLTI